MKFSTFVAQIPCDKLGRGSKSGKNLTSCSGVEGVGRFGIFGAPFRGKNCLLHGIGGSPSNLRDGSKVWCSQKTPGIIDTQPTKKDIEPGEKAG